MNIKKFNSLSFFMLLLLAVGLWQAHGLLIDHFTHMDDTGVAVTLLIRTPGESSCNLRFTNLESKIHLELPFLKSVICTISLWYARLFIISDQWTYAPFQFWFTQALLDPRLIYTYEQIKYFGRLPSFFALLCGLLAFYMLVIKRITTLGARPYLALAMTTILGFSLEQRIMSAQMESYAIGLLSNCLVLYGFIRLLDKSELNVRSILFSATLVAIGVSMQYQAILLAFGGFIALLIHQFKKSFSFHSYVYLLAMGGASVYFSYVLVGDISRLANRGVLWNAGPANEYLVQGASLLDRSQSLLKLISFNINYNLYSIVSAIELSDKPAQIFGAGIFFLIILGLIWLIKYGRSCVDRYLLLLSIFYCLIYLSVLYIGKLTFSPTRHFLYFLPIVIILVGYGVIFLLNHLPYRNFSQRLLIGIFLVYLAISIISFSEFKKKREDLLSNEWISNILKETKPDFILLGGVDHDLLLIDSANQKPIYDYYDGPQCSRHKRFLIQDNQKVRFLWFSKRYEQSEGDANLNKYITEAINNCAENFGGSWDLVSYRKLKDVVRITSDTEIDLSNRTKNGSNNYFVQLYEVETKFHSQLYSATLEDGIDFKKSSYPNFLSFVTGLSQRENWGRWSDAYFGGEVVQFGFKRALPKKFILEFKAIPYAENGRYPTRVKVGRQEQLVYIDGDSSTQYRLNFDNAQDSDLIEFFPPRPTQPRQLNPLDTDPRRLGIGFISLKIQPN